MSTTTTTGIALQGACGTGYVTIGSGGMMYAHTLARADGVAQLRALLESIRYLAAAAEKIGKLMDGTEPLDPEKARLYESVAALEKLVRRQQPKAAKPRKAKA